MKYRAYGRVLSSALDLPELEAADSALDADLVIGVHTIPASPEEWSWTRPPFALDDGPWVAVAAREGRYRILFDNGADFIVTAASRTIDVLVDVAAEPAIRHRLIDQVVPLTLAHFGQFVLHASAIVMPSGHAVAFVGPAGAGKSTLAAALARAGGRVLSDDALVIERRGRALYGVPAYPAVRVRPEMFPVLGNPPGDPAEGKRRAGTLEGICFASAPARLTRIYALRDDTKRDVVIESLAAREGLMALLAHAFVLDTSDRERVAAQFARVAESSAYVDVKMLAYPRALSALPALGEALAADLDRP